MADQFDRAQELDAMAVQAAMAEQQRKAAAEPRLKPTGSCLNPACDLPLDKPGALFCDLACGHEYQRRTRK